MAVRKLPKVTEAERLEVARQVLERAREEFTPEFLEYARFMTSGAAEVQHDEGGRTTA